VDGPLEITDLLWSLDTDGALLPVLQGDVVRHLAGRGQRRAARIVSQMPAIHGVLDQGYVDALGVRVHCELQRLGEELQFGRRLAALLSPIVADLRRSCDSPVRVVDVGVVSGSSCARWRQPWCWARTWNWSVLT